MANTKRESARIADQVEKTVTRLRDKVFERVERERNHGPPPRRVDAPSVGELKGELDKLDELLGRCRKNLATAKPVDLPTKLRFIATCEKRQAALKSAIERLQQPP